MINRKKLINIDAEKAMNQYIKAAVKGIVKTMSTMGISTIQSYRGAQIFEAVGLNSAVVDKYFKRTASRIEGIDIDGVAREVTMRHLRAFPGRDYRDEVLDAGGVYKWRHDGEHHALNPTSIHLLQSACRMDNMDVFRKYSDSINNQSKKLATLRGLIDFEFPQDGGIPIDD